MLLLRIHLQVKPKYAKWLMLLAYFGIKKLNNPDFYVIWYALEESEEEFIQYINYHL